MRIGELSLTAAREALDRPIDDNLALVSRITG
ncbi:hypothetical protein HNP84_004721 [Thermocatellispora tengchongensis]|uniref:Uncharacterized protein n=1 Tax=Thermocatellispora tengchongensis TaxID=1073253 RepID=A0A840PCU2_9ACTN|nr:hypothetical protein [Thermocatellispora tengchongensis]